MAEQAVVKSPSRLSVVGRDPPHDDDAEVAVLGAALLDAEAARQAVAELQAEDFYRPAHKLVFAAIARLVLEASPVDAVTVADELRRAGAIDAIGGDLGLLLSLQVQTPGTRQVPVHAAIVARCAARRRRLALLGEIAEATRLDDEAAEALLERLADTRAPSRLQPEDVGALMDGTLLAVEPTLLRRNDGKALLLSGAVTLVHGEPSAGKTWLAAEAMRQVLTEGRSVVVLDYEGSAGRLARRLVELGVDRALTEKLYYYRPSHTAPGAVLQAAMSHDPALVVLDGYAAGCVDLGLDENLARDSLVLLRHLCRPLAVQGAAVVVIDHVTKSKDERGRWGRGNGAKLGEADAAFTLSVAEYFSRDYPGSSILRIAKDRDGAVGPEGSVAAIFRFDFDRRSEILALAVEVPAEVVDREEMGPLNCIQAVADLLCGRPNEEMSANAIIGALKDLGKGYRRETVLEAAQRLSQDPDWPISSKTGPRGAVLYWWEAARTPLGLFAEDDF